VLELAVDGLAPDVILNRRHWVAPVAPGVAWTGATHEPGNVDATPTAGARRSLEESARTLLARPFTVRGQRAGVRVNLPDKRPVVGPHPEHARLGVCNGLGAKGALVAPWLARMWAEHIARGVAFDAEVDVARYSRR
jgi:glycine oxidase